MHSALRRFRLSRTTTLLRRCRPGGKAQGLQPSQQPLAAVRHRGLVCSPCISWPWHPVTAFLHAHGAVMARKITAIRAQKRHPQRVNIYLDGEFAFGLARIVAAWLQVGQELSEQDIARLQREDAREQAYQQALRYLGYRPRTTHEIRRHLERKGVAEEIIAAVLERLSDLGLVDDEAFAHAWVASRMHNRPRSRRALHAELRQKGLPEAIIQEALAEVDEAAGAYLAAQKGARRYRHLPWPAFRQKMSAYLARRGFPYTVIREAVQRAWQEIHPHTPSASSEVTPNDEEPPCMD